MVWRFGLLLILVARALPCSCSSNGSWVRQAWKDAPAVFLGTVEIADPDGDPRQTTFVEQFVRIRVDEAFKGVVAGQTISLNEGGSDCDARFRTGQRAVFYLQAGTTPGTWFIPWCAYSIGSAEPEGDDLLFLRGLPGTAAGTRLSGSVDLYEDSPQAAFRRVRGLANLRVKIFGPDGLAREALTNTAGTYEVYGLKPGKYSVRIDMPKGLRTKFPMATGSVPVAGDESAVELARDGEASVSFVLEADTKLSGRMLDAKGVPKQDVCIDLEPLEGRGENGARFFDCSKEQTGVFEMEMMPPGDYLLVARDEVGTGDTKSKSTLYYPGVRQRESAKVISIAAGDYVSGIEMQLPAGEVRHKVNGRLVFSDGQPVAGAGVTFVSAEHGYSESAGTADDGAFAFFVVAGMSGQLSAETFIFQNMLASCPEFQVEPRKSGMLRFMKTDSIVVAGDSDQADLVLKFPFPSCKSWKGYPSRKP